VIDPLDGTVNFSHGLLYWGVSIAHFENGTPKTAALYFPSSNELFSAVRGGGAELNGMPLRVGKDIDQEMFPLFLHCSRMHKLYQADLPYKKRSLGAAAYHLCLISKNTAILAFESTVKIWDFAAAWLVIKEAGAVIESFSDKIPFPAQPGTDYQKVPFPLAAASSQSVMDQAREKIIRI
jgi:myo-inositol-1(or 4)-monophosphatase